MIILRQKEYGVLGAVKPSIVSTPIKNPKGIYLPNVSKAKEQLKSNGLDALHRSINLKGKGSMNNPIVKSNLANGIRFDRSLGY